MKKPTHVPLFDERSRVLDRFGILLLVTVASIVILMLVDIEPRTGIASGRWEAALATVMVGATLLLALRASGLSSRYQRMADLIVGVAILGVVALAITATFSDRVPAPGRAAPPLVVLLAVAAPLAVIRRLARHKEVTRGTLLGAISGYLLLPIAFFYLFLTSSTVGGTFFFGKPEPTQAYMYFSLTTITTTGYGDLTAQEDYTRLLATGEAVLGQIYMVTFVAMLVGLFISGRRSGTGLHAMLHDVTQDDAEDDAQRD